MKNRHPNRREFIRMLTLAGAGTLFLPELARAYPEDSPNSEPIRETIFNKTVNPDFVYALIRAESGGVSNIVSRSGALGLMQLMRAGAYAEYRQAHPNTPFTFDQMKDPESNLIVGIWNLWRASDIISQQGYLPPRDEHERIDRTKRISTCYHDGWPTYKQKGITQNGINHANAILRYMPDNPLEIIPENIRDTVRTVTEREIERLSLV